MKNITLKIITTVSLVISSLSMPFTISAEQTYPLGDANHDGNVNVRDAACIAHYLANRKNYLLPEEADYNQDGSINVRDAAVIANDIAKRKINKITVTTQPVVTTTETTTIPVTTNVTNTETSTTTASILSETNAVTTAKSNVTTTNTLSTSVTTTTTAAISSKASFTTAIKVNKININQLRNTRGSDIGNHNIDIMFDKYIERFPTKYENVPYTIAIQDWFENNYEYVQHFYANELMFAYPIANYKMISSTNGETKDYQVVRDSGIETVSLPVYKTIAVQRTIYQNDIPHDIVTDTKVYDYDYKNSETAQSEYAKYDWKAHYNKSKQEIEYFYCDECDTQLAPDDEFWTSYYPNLLKTELTFTTDATEPVSIITRTCNTVTESQYIDPITGEVDEYMTVDAANSPIDIDFDYYFNQAESASPSNETVDYECKRTKINTEVSKYKPIISFNDTPDIFELIKIDNDIANIDEMIAKITNS